MVTSIWLGALTAVSGLAFIYPYLVYPLTLRLLPTVPVHHLPQRSDGSGFTLAFCAYNEIRVLPEKLENIATLRKRYPGLEVLVYDDGSNDGTFELLQTHPDLVTAVQGTGRQGKAHGMKQLVSMSSGRFLVFTDANVMLDSGCLDALAAYYNDPSVGGVCGSLHYLSSADGSSTEVTGGFYWKLEERIKTLESATGNVMGADGSIFSVRRELYPDFPDTVQDDFTVSMSVVFAGSRLIRAHDVIAYERLVAERADETRRKVRIAARAFHTHTVLKPGLRRMATIDRYKYAAHKLLRWWGAAPAALAMVATLGFLLSFGRPGVIVLACCLAMLAGMRLFAPKITAIAVDLLVAVTATFRGVLRALRGETFQVWTPPASR
jgi:cellulose synthase/poly-beta-1,6-N-acetylglucosamine synthase-like glycosyltransferase